MPVHDPTKKPTLHKLQQGLKQFEEGFVIYEAMNRNGPAPLPMEVMWQALTVYRELVNDQVKKEKPA